MNNFNTIDQNSELFFKTAALKNLNLNSEKINLACTFLLKVKDINYLELKPQESNSKFPYNVVVYENENKENAEFKSKKEAEDFIETLQFINQISNK